MTVLIDTTVQKKKTRKNITYPTDARLAIKSINRLKKLAQQNGIQQRRTLVKEVKDGHFRYVKKRTSAKRTLEPLLIS